MGEKSLYDLFEEDQIEDLMTVFLRQGIEGIMSGFESWLYANGLIDEDGENRFREEKP